MAGNRIICSTNNVDYITIRKAMCEGARTVDELVDKTGVCTNCEGCKDELDNILSSVCGRCKALIKNIIELGR
jgi:bacterioferritin-associated ferredoxin